MLLIQLNFGSKFAITNEIGGLFDISKSGCEMVKHNNPENDRNVPVQYVVIHFTDWPHTHTHTHMSESNTRIANVIASSVFISSKPEMSLMLAALEEQVERLELCFMFKRC
jgi:hypothetical protein